MLKRQELADPTSCLNKAGPAEPLFVIRAKDPVGAQTIRHWATMSAGQHDAAKIASALKLADEMDTFRARQDAPAVAERAA